MDCKHKAPFTLVKDGQKIHSIVITSVIFLSVKHMTLKTWYSFIQFNYFNCSVFGFYTPNESKMEDTRSMHDVCGHRLFLDIFNVFRDLRTYLQDVQNMGITRQNNEKY